MQERKWILEDFAEIHRRCFEVALASALTVAHPPIDLYTHIAVFKLSYRLESEGNPSTAFTLDSAAILPEDLAREALGLPEIARESFNHHVQVFRDLIAKGDKEERATNPMYMGWVVCICTRWRFSMDIWTKHHQVGRSTNVDQRA